MEPSKDELLNESTENTTEEISPEDADQVTGGSGNGGGNSGRP